MMNWFEVWADETLDPPYLLLVRGSLDTFRVLDPKDANRVVFESKDYETVKLWLLEDEYEMVRGRKDLDE